MDDTRLASERAATASGAGDDTKVTSLEKARQKRDARMHREARLHLLMAEFLAADRRGDEDAKRMYGRGLAVYSREELNAAERRVKNGGAA